MAAAQAEQAANEEISASNLALLTTQPERLTMFRRFHIGIEGWGAGLKGAKKIVKNSGDKLLVESTPGVGFVFSVYFRR